MAYQVETGIRGATRITTREFESAEAAMARAERWAQSNSQGHYWAEVTRNGVVIARFNLPTPQ